MNMLMEENEKLRGLLREAIHCCPDEQLRNEMKAALSQQAEHDHVEDMRAMVEPAPARDERTGYACHQCRAETPAPEPYKLYVVCQACGASTAATAAQALARPAQTEQKPVAVVDAGDDGMWADILPDVTVKVGQMLYAAPIAQTAPQAVKLQHMAYAEDGALHWMSGRKIDHCELYAMPDFGRAPQLYAAPQTEQSWLLEALRDAAQSLETISNGAGKDEFMRDMADIRGYARSRAGVARAALSAQGGEA